MAVDADGNTDKDNVVAREDNGAKALDVELDGMEMAEMERMKAIRNEMARSGSTLDAPSQDMVDGWDDFDMEPISQMHLMRPCRRWVACSQPRGWWTKSQRMYEAMAGEPWAHGFSRAGNLTCEQRRHGSSTESP